MSLDWHWVFPVAGNSHHWKPSEIVSIEHFIGLIADVKPVLKDQGRIEGKLLLSDWFCLGVCVVLYVIIDEVDFFFWSLTKDERHIVKSLSM